MLSPESPVIGICRIPERVWCQVLVTTPASPEKEATYWAVRREGVDPAFALAIFRHESAYGTQGVCAAFSTRNPGNTRSSRTGEGAVIQTPKGPFVRYPSWEAGFRDLAYRLVDPHFVYAQEGRRTIGTILERWAPGSDGNDPDGYIQAVIAEMERLMGFAFPNLTLTPSPNYDRGRPGPVKWIVVHTTEGDFASSVSWLTNPASGVSAHFVVGGEQVAQLVDLGDVSWAAGNYPVNQAAVNVELVGRAREHPPVDELTFRTGAALVRQLAELLGIPLVKRSREEVLAGLPGVVGHVDVPNPYDPSRGGGMSGHIDPGPFFDWGRFLGQEGGGAADPVRSFPETGYGIQFGFRAFWEKLEAQGLALLVLGYPVSWEQRLVVDGQERTVQLFERGALIWEPENPAPWDVHLATVEQLKQILTALGR